MEKILILTLILLPVFGAFVSYFIGKKNKNIRNAFAIAICALVFATVIALYRYVGLIEFSIDGVMGFGISFSLSGFRYVYIVLTSLGWLLTCIFSTEYFGHYRNRNRYYFFMLLTLSGTLGVFLSADLITTFLFFEVMSIASFVLVIHDEKLKTRENANVYLYVSVLSGLVLLFGILMLCNLLGTVEISSLYEKACAYENKKLLYVACGLMAFGFATKAGTFPMHIWLPKAHPVAPAPASALLSGIMIKTGFFGMLVISSEILRHDLIWGNILLAFGIITMFLGAALALFSVDIKRTLACSSVSQSGFITTGIAMQCVLGSHNAFAAYGTSLHMINHSLIKLALFMAAGVIYIRTHELNLNEIRGYGRNKPLLMIVFAVCALTLMGIPGTSGYISKTLLHESIAEQIAFAAGSASEWYYSLCEYVFLFTGGLTVAYMIKIFVAVFVEKPSRDNEERFKTKKYIKPLSGICVALPCVLLPVFGIFPHKIFEKIAEFCAPFMHAHAPEHAPHYLSFVCLKGALISVSIGLILYFVVVRLLLMKKYENKQSFYVNVIPDWVDIELEMYRPLITKFIPLLLSVFCRFFDRLADSIGALSILIYKFMKNEVYFTLSKKDGADNPVVGENAVLDTISSSLLLFSVGLFTVLLYLILS